MKPAKEPLVLPFICTLAFLLLGLSLIIWPNAVISVFPPLIGLVLIIVGALGVAQCIVLHRRLMVPHLRLIQSFVNIIVGFIFIFRHDISLAFLAILFGIYILVSSAIKFYQSLQDRRGKKPWAGNFAQSIFEFLLGLVLLKGPFSEKNFWIRILGIYFILSAHAIFHWLLSLKNLRKANDKEHPPE